MNTQVILEALANTYNPDATIRSSAEKLLTNASSTPGFLVSLLKLVADSSIGVDIRLAASLLFKNAMLKNWIPLDPDLLTPGTPMPPGRYVISDEDRSIIKQNIFDALVLAGDLRIHKILAQAIGKIARNDYPKTWPTLMEQIGSYLTSNEQNKVGGILVAIRYMVKEEQFNRSRDTINAYATNLTPVLRHLLSELAKMSDLSAMVMVKYILKIVFSMINFELPPVLAQFDEMQRWHEMLEGILSSPVPPEFAQDDTSPFWKNKVWVGRIVQKVYERYGQPSTSEYQDFAKQFSNSGIPVRCLGVCLTMLGSKMQNGAPSCPDSVVQQCLGYVSCCVRPGKTFAVLSNHLPALVEHIIFPLMCFTPTLAEEFEHEPEEYIRKTHAVLVFEPTLYNCVVHLISHLLEMRQKRSLPVFMQFVEARLAEYEGAPANAKPYSAKFGVLNLLSCLQPVLCSSKEFKPNVEGLVMQHIVADFEAPQAFVRGRAVSVFHYYACDMNWQNLDNATRSMEKLLPLLRDQNITVRADAAISLGKIVEPKQENCHVLLPVVTNNLEAIIKSVLNIMGEITCDDVVLTLHAIIQCYDQDLAPMAAEIVQSMATVFFANVDNDDDDGEDEAELTSMSCLEGINTLLVAVCENQAILTQMLPVVMTILRKVIVPSSEYQDLFETVFHMLGNVAYMLNDVPHELLAFMKPVHDLFMGDAFDYLDVFSVAIENMMEKHPQAFVQGNPNTGDNYVEMVVAMAKKVLEYEDAGRHDMRYACILLRSLLQSCKGAIDNALPVIVDMSMKRLAFEEMIITKLDKNDQDDMVQCTETEKNIFDLVTLLQSALWSNPTICLRGIGEANLQKVFTLVFESIPQCKQEHEKKLNVLTACALLQIPLGSLPPILQQVAGPMLDKAVEIIVDMEQTRQQEAAENEGDQEDEEGEIPMVAPTAFNDADILDDEDFVDEKEEEYLKMVQRMREEGLGDMGGFGFDDEDDEDDNYVSPIDHVDEFVTFHDAIQAMLNNPQGGDDLKQLVSSRSAEVRQNLELIMMKAQENIQAAKNGSA